MSGTLKKQPVGVRIIWSIDMENMLLDLWEKKIEELRGARKNSHIFQEIGTVMQQSGITGNWMDVPTKVNNLTRKYKQERNKIGPTGGAPSGLCHYNKVHSILGSFKLRNIEGSMNESTDISTLMNDVIEFDSNASCGTQQLNFSDEQYQRKDDNSSELVRLAQERIELQRLQQEERKEQVNDMMERLDAIASQKANFQTQLLDILKAKNN